MQSNSMNYQGTYKIDRQSVLQKTYYLLCLFFAEKEISRRSSPGKQDAPLRSLESMFFESETSKLLLEIAIAVRVVDEQMNKLPSGDPVRAEYERRKAEVDTLPYGLFDDLNLDLRQTCNKIIHSDVMELHYTDGVEAHEDDAAYKYGDGDKTIEWKHWNGYVRLCGKTTRGSEWYVLLDVEVYVTGVYTLLSNN
ncbi:hypothetical protein ACTJJ0_22265 [Chitinophaga sp. 22321]|uniref:hypothetical protein n=1 Tax=Chitinophaga sp. 22321 TaxID=3453909 RepID=UPI003F84C0A9